MSFLWLSVLALRMQFLRLILRPEKNILQEFSRIIYPVFKRKYIFLPYKKVLTFQNNTRETEQKGIKTGNVTGKCLLGNQRSVGEQMKTSYVFLEVIASLKVYTDCVL